MKIIDRYVIRQVLMPFCLGLMVFTFLLIIPSLLKYGEEFVAKGVAILVVLQLMATLIPQAIALTIPMSLLLALLIGFGKLSADREFVAMQACGVSLARLLRPVALLSLVACAATGYVMIVSLPAANQTFNEITFRILSQAAEGEVKPRVFFTKFTNLTIYVRDIPPGGGGWDGVFIDDRRPGQTSAVYVARHGRVVINRDKQTVEMVLEDATSHTMDASGKYDVGHAVRLVMTIDPKTVFQQQGPGKGPHEMTIPELQAHAAELQKAGLDWSGDVIAIHQKFSIPVACLVFGLIGLALGATNRRAGAFGSFVLGILVVIAYYIPLYLGPAMARGGDRFPPWMAAWMPDVALGLVGIALFAWRTRLADQPIRIPLPSFRRRDTAQAAPRARRSRDARGGPMRILDRYVAWLYLRVMALTAISLMTLFQISTFIDRSGQVFKGVATWPELWAFMGYMTPQYVYYVLPLSVLLSAMVTISVLTKNSELIVMKACGISIYRITLPMLVCAVACGGVLFGLDATVLGEANHRADYLLHLMRGGSPDAYDIVDRHWAVGNNGVIYHYNGFNPRLQQMMGLDVFELGEGMASLKARTVADRADYAGRRSGAPVDLWEVKNGWTRQFGAAGDVTRFTPFADTTKRFETASYFGTQLPEPQFMRYAELRRYTLQLQAAGFDVLEQKVGLARKVAFPFVTLIMTLIAIPFASTTGRSGAMAGLGVGIGLAIVYWTATSIFGALGSGGLIAPVMAAWAPNLLFGAGAAYLLLTVRT